MITLDLSASKKLIQNIVKDAKNLDWSEVGRMGLTSIDKNFQASGRYSQAGAEIGGSTKWAKRKDKKTHPILVKSGGMKNGVFAKPTGNGVELISNKVYSAAQNYGYAKRNLPARPFMTIPPDELQNMGKSIVDQLVRKFNR